jgi:hypothetical protein
MAYWACAQLVPNHERMALHFLEQIAGFEIYAPRIRAPRTARCQDPRTNGLGLGAPYSVSNYPTGNNPATGLPWSPATDGLRNLTGRVNGDGTVTIWAITSTVSGNGDQGADPNQLVMITDTLSATSPEPKALRQFALRGSAKSSAASLSRQGPTWCHIKANMRM